MRDLVKLSIASGKGGTGKTTIAVNLAAALAHRGHEVTYVDCDVEEPNGHIFLKPKIGFCHNVSVPVPVIDFDKCTFCGMCADICRFNAIAVFPGKVMVFSSLCHSCGGCFHICPEKAISEIPRPIGEIRHGHGFGVGFRDGSLSVGEALAPPITRALKRELPDRGVIIIDAPPGSSCPVIEAVVDSDYVILVTEPTPFGLNDLKLAVEMVRQLNLPLGVIINRSDIGNGQTEAYCREKNIEILMRIPFERKMAEKYSVGEMLIADRPDFDKALFAMFENIARRVQYA